MHDWLFLKGNFKRQETIKLTAPRVVKQFHKWFEDGFCAVSSPVALLQFAEKLRDIVTSVRAVGQGGAKARLNDGWNFGFKFWARFACRKETLHTLQHDKACPRNGKLCKDTPRNDLKFPSRLFGHSRVGFRYLFRQSGDYSVGKRLAR
jgi:hypothetical protein